MHIVLLNQAFYPDVVSTAQMAKDLADELVVRGHRVTAIASRSIYGHKGAALPKRQTVPVESGRIEIRRVGSSVFGKRGLASRAADFFLFYVRATMALLTMPRADVVVAFTTPPFIALASLLTGVVRRHRTAYWVMDVYPDVLVAAGAARERSMLVRLLESLHRTVLRRVDAVVVLGRCMRERILAKGCSADRVHLIPVWADATALTPPDREHNAFRAEHGLGSSFVVMYSGNLGLGHDAATICEAMRLLRDEPAVRFEFVGGGKRREDIERFIAQQGLTNARWHDYQPRERLAESLGAGDVHLISQSVEMEGLIVPSKLYGIMAAGRPSILIGPAGSEIARVLKETDSGLVVPPGDAADLAGAIRRLAGKPDLARAMGERARSAALHRYDRSIGCAAWAGLLERMVRGADRTGTGVPARAQGAGERP